MEVKEFSMSGFSAEDPLNQEERRTPTRVFQPGDPGGIRVKEDPYVFQPGNPGGVSLGGSQAKQKEVEATIRGYLQNSTDPEGESAKIDVSLYFADKLKVPFSTFYDNYDKNIERVFGQTMKPKKALQFIKDQFTAADISTKISELGNQKLFLPKEYHETLDREIERLTESMPNVDPFKHNIAVTSGGLAAGMVPYIVQVGKYAIPGAAITLGAGLLTGGTGAVPAAAATVKTVGSLVSLWGKVKSFQEGYKLMTGDLYNSLTTMVDENGENIDDNIARKITMWSGIPLAGLEAVGAEYFLTGNSVIKSLVNKIGSATFKKRVESAAAKTAIDLTLKEFWKQQAKNMAKGTGKLLAYEILGEEIPQEIITIQATEMAKHFTNDLKGTEFEDITSEEYKTRLEQTLIKSFEGMFVLGLGRSGVNTLNGYRQYMKSQIKQQTNEKASQAILDEDEKQRLYVYGSEEEVDIIDEEELAKIQTESNVEVETTDREATVKVDGKKIGTAEYIIEDDLITINTMPTTDKLEATKIVNDIKDRFRGYRVAFSPKLSENVEVVRAIEDTNEDIAVQNEIIDETKAEISNINDLLDSNKTELAQLSQEEEQEESIALVQENIDTLEKDLRVAIEKLEATEIGKLKLAEKKLKPLKDMSAEEYNKEFPLEESPHLKDTKEGKDLRNKLSEYSNIKEDQLDVALDLVDMIARGQNKTPVQWLKETFKKGVVERQRKGEPRASVDLRVTSEAIIKLAEKSDFSSWVHELAHVFRKQLLGEDLVIATKWAEKKSKTKAKNGIWTPKMEEVFASGFETYIKEGREGEKIDSVFDKMARFMRTIYETLRDATNLPSLSPEIRKVFDNQLAPSRLNALKEGTTGLELFQPKHKEAIKKAVEKGFEVPQKTLEQISDKWAVDALAKIKSDEIMLEDHDGLVQDVRLAISEDDFIAQKKAFDTEDWDEDTEQWYRNFYKVATRDRVTDINTGNKEWAKEVNTDYAKELIISVSRNIQAAISAGVPGNIIAPANRYLVQKTISDKSLTRVVKTLKNNPSSFRSLASDFIGDMEEVRKVEQEREFSVEIGIEEYEPAKKTFQKRMDIADQLKDEDFKQKIRTGAITGKNIIKIVEAADKEVDGLKKELAEFKKKLSEETSIDLKKFKRIREIYQEHLKEIKKLNKDNAKYKEQVPALKDTIFSARKEATLMKNEALKVLKEKQKDRDLKRKLKTQMEKLGRQIKKNIPASVDATYIKAIKLLQDSVDPKFRSEATLTLRQFEREFHDTHPEMKDILPYGDYKKIHAKALNEYTLGELEAIKGKIEVLEATGKAEKQARDIKKAMEDEQGKTIVTTQLYSKGVLENNKAQELETFNDKVKENALKVFRPTRLMDMLDAAKGRIGKMGEGPITRYITDRITKAYNNEVKAIFNRRDGLKKKMKELGLKRSDYLKTVKVRNEKFTIDAIMDIYAGWKNSLKREAIEGMGIDQAFYDELVSNLSDKHIELANYIIEDYATNFEALRQAALVDKNIDLPQEDFYTPIRRIIKGVTADELDSIQEMLDRHSYSRAKVTYSGTIKRVKLKNQIPIQLGLISTWDGAVTKHEHYVHNIETVKHLSTVFGSKEVSKAAHDVGKSKELQAVMKYFKRYVNPMAMKSFHGWDKTVRWLKNNSAVAFLAYSIPTMFKQVPSLLYFTAEAGPADLFGAIFQVGSHWKESRAVMDKLAPEISVGRSFESFVNSLEYNASSKGKYMINKMGEVGLRGIQYFDEMTVTVGWTATYNRHKRKGASDLEAARLASKAVLTTQPASGAKDAAELYATDNMLSVFLQFSNQLNQLFNLQAYDLPQAVLNREIKKATVMFISYALGGALIWAISNRRVPQDDEDKLDMLTDQFFNVIPGVGKTLGSYVDGYDLSVPVLEPVFGIGKGIQALKGLALGKGITKDQAQYLAETMYEGFAIGVGIPYTEAMRIYKGFREGEPLPYIIFGGELNDK